MNTPHTHPRATEINFSVNGTLRTGLLTENGARFVVNSLPAGSATIFPMVHQLAFLFPKMVDDLPLVGRNTF